MSPAVFPALRAYFDALLATDFRADRARLAAVEALAAWFAVALREHGAASAVVVCTGNSRRSVLGAMLGNAAAAYLGLRVSFHSAGTTPTAVNPRSLRTLRDVGFEIQRTGHATPQGLSGEFNPIYSIRWGPRAMSATLEFSKCLADPSLPATNFAALLVCDEASQTCPQVAGAAVRVAMPCEDPKASDGTPHELAAYQECRDEIARAVLQSLVQAKR